MSETTSNSACVYVTDRNFLPCTCFSIKTLTENAAEPLPVYVLWADADARDIDAARGYLHALGVDVHFIEISGEAFAGLPRPKALPRATYGRLMMHKLLPAHLTRVLYIDGDTLVDIDVTPLMNLNLDGAAVGAVLDIGRVLIGRRAEAQSRLALGPDRAYFNAGVMLIDWQQWLRDDLGEACVRALLNEPHRFVQKDQCALNYICRGRWKALDWKWNYQPACVVHEEKDAALFHFLGKRKPWRADHVRHPARFVQRYEQMYRASPWAGAFKPPLLPYAVLDGLRVVKKIVSPRYWKNIPRYAEIAARGR